MSRVSRLAAGTVSYVVFHGRTKIYAIKVGPEASTA